MTTDCVQAVGPTFRLGVIFRPQWMEK